MRIAIISDIHSNLEALEVVLEEINKVGVDQIYCLGDMVGYNANPSECLSLIQECGVLCVAGNHDMATIGMTDTDYFSPAAKIAAEWSGKQLSDIEKEMFRKLPLVRKTADATFVHASLEHPAEWSYILTPMDAETSFLFQETPLCFIGHSHYPIIFDDQGGMIDSPRGEIQLDREKRYILNVGSVGQPRDRNPDSSFVFFDTEKWTVNYKRLAYHFTKTQEKVFAAGLPPYLAERLAVGR